MGGVTKSLPYQTAFAKKEKAERREDSYNVHLKDAGLPVPDEQTIIPLLALTSYDADKVALYPVLAVSRSNVPGLLQTKDSLIDREGVGLTGRKCAHKHATG
jgi:hypothetical protein